MLTRLHSMSYCCDCFPDFVLTKHLYISGPTSIRHILAYVPFVSSVNRPLAEKMKGSYRTFVPIIIYSILGSDVIHADTADNYMSHNKLAQLSTVS